MRTGALGAALCVPAGAFGVAALYVPGVALMLLSAAACFSVGLSARGARVDLELSCEHLQEGDAADLRVHVARPFASFSRGEVCPSPGAPWAPLGPRARVRRLELRAHRRGEVVVGPATVRYADPFGICSRELTSEARRLLVLPRVERVRRVDVERLLRGRAAGGESDSDGGIDGLAPYRAGAPASRIHWLTVARTGELLERAAAEEAPDSPAMVVLDTRSAADVEAVDRAVRAAASLCAALARAGGCSLLLPGDARVWTVGHDMTAWPEVLAKLALVARGRAPEWRAARGARWIVLVCAGEPQVPRGREAGVTFTVGPQASGRGAALFEVAGCAVRPAPRGRSVRAG